MFESVARSVYYQLRRLFLGGYYRLITLNYDHTLIAPQKQLCGGVVRSYELYNRHGNDAMLAEMHSHCPTDAVVYDIGANVGVYSLSLAIESAERTIVAFEPSPTVFDQLSKNVALNELEEQITLFQVGLGDTSGSQPFYTSSYTELSSFRSESATRWEARIATTEPVEIVRLDEFVDSHIPPDVLKIDVEGTEAAVLRGAAETLTQHRPVVFVELHEDGLGPEMPEICREVLLSYEYEITERPEYEYWVCTPR